MYTSHKKTLMVNLDKNERKPSQSQVRFSISFRCNINDISARPKKPKVDKRRVQQTEHVVDPQLEYDHYEETEIQEYEHYENHYEHTDAQYHEHQE